MVSCQVIASNIAKIQKDNKNFLLRIRTLGSGGCRFAIVTLHLSISGPYTSVWFFQFRHRSSSDRHITRYHLRLLSYNYRGSQFQIKSFNAK